MVVCSGWEVVWSGWEVVWSGWEVVWSRWEVVWNGWEVVLSQSPKNLVGASALPTGKFLRVRKVFARFYKIGHKMKPKHQLNSE